MSLESNMNKEVEIRVKELNRLDGDIKELEEKKKKIRESIKVEYADHEKVIEKEKLSNKIFSEELHRREKKVIALEKNIEKVINNATEEALKKKKEVEKIVLKAKSVSMGLKQKETRLDEQQIYISGELEKLKRLEKTINPILANAEEHEKQARASLKIAQDLESRNKRENERLKIFSAEIEKSYRYLNKEKTKLEAKENRLKEKGKSFDNESLNLEAKQKELDREKEIIVEKTRKNAVLAREIDGKSKELDEKAREFKLITRKLEQTKKRIELLRGET